MSKNLFNVRLFSSLLFAGALVTAGCTDNDYDFDQIDLLSESVAKGLRFQQVQRKKLS